MKDELGGKIMTEFIVLRVKMYAYRNIDKKVEDKHCKGTKKCVVTESLTFDDYKACLLDGKTIYRQKILFENKKHVATDIELVISCFLYIFLSYHPFLQSCFLHIYTKMSFPEKSFQRYLYYIIKQRFIVFICMKSSKFIFEDVSSMFDYFLRIFSHVRDIPTKSNDLIV